MYVPGPKKPEFDIRSLLHDAELDSDHVQARYDTVNRMAMLIGDVKFKDLFTQDWQQAVPPIIERASACVEYGLLRDRPELGDTGEVRYCFECLCQGGYASYCWCTYMEAGFDSNTETYDPALQSISDTHVSLWRHGIYLPFLTGSKRKDPYRQAALKGLVEQAGDLTYKEVYQRLAGGKEKWPDEQLLAVNRAFSTGAIFSVAPNEKCCDPDLVPQRCRLGDPEDNCVGCVGTTCGPPLAFRE